VKLSLLEVVLYECGAENCFVVIMWCSCDMIGLLQNFRVSNLLDIVRFTSVNLICCSEVGPFINVINQVTAAAVFCVVVLLL